MTTDLPMARHRLAPEVASAIDALFAEVDSPDHPGAVVAVVHAGEVVHLRCFGLANVEDGVPVTPDTVFRLGSVTKHLSATLVLIAEDRGLVELDAPAARYLPEMPACAAAVTVRHLLTMTSGFPDGVAMTIFGGRGHLAMTPAQHLEMVVRTRELMFEPGAEMLYSNTNYMLLTLLVERVMGAGLTELMRRELFAPLGMDSAQLTLNGLDAVPNKARGYLPTGERGRYRQGLMLYEAAGDGGVDMSMPDFIRWFLNYRSDRLVARDYRPRMEREVRLNNGELSDYRTGMEISPRGPWTKVRHAGGMPGYLADFCYYPEPDLGLLMFTNFMQPKLLEVTDRLPELMGIKVPAPTTDTPTPGLYIATARGMALQIVDNGKDRLCYMMGDPTPLLADGPGRWRPAKRGDCFRIEARPGGALAALFGASPEVLFGPWSEPEDEQLLEELAGLYRSPVLGETHRVLVGEDGGLQVRLDTCLRQLAWSGLTRRARDVFTAAVPDEPSQSNLTLRFERDLAGQVTGFRYSTFRCRDILFERQDA